MHPRTIPMRGVTAERFRVAALTGVQGRECSFRVVCCEDWAERFENTARFRLRGGRVRCSSARRSMRAACPSVTVRGVTCSVVAEESGPREITDAARADR